MMGSTTKRESTLHNILDQIETVHKKDIQDFSSGHLNESRLWKQKVKLDTKSWESAKRSPITSHKHVSVPKINRLSTNVQDMNNVLVDYVTRNGNISSQRKKAISKSRVQPTEDTSKLDSRKNMSDVKVLTGEHKVKSTDWRASRITPDSEYSAMASVTPAPDLPDIAERIGSAASLNGRALVEELSPLEFSIPRSNYPARNSSYEDAKNNAKSDTIKMPFAEGSRRDQYMKMQKFKSDIIRDHDTKDTNLMSGMQAVEHLEYKLRVNLEKLDRPTYGPNFHRLQIYSAVFDDLIQDSSIFGHILAEIKDQYDNYVSYLLDQPPAQTSLLAAQLEQLHRSGASEDSLSVEQDRLSQLEEIVGEELHLRERRRRELLNQQEELDRVLTESPQSAVLRSRRKVAGEEERSAKSRSVLGQIQHQLEMTESIGDKCETLKARIWEKLDELSDLRSDVREKCVPTAVCAHLEQCNHDTEIEVQKLEKQREFLMQANSDLERELREALEGWEVSEGDERRIWKSVNTTVLEESDSEGEDENKWNWYIS